MAASTHATSLGVLFPTQVLDEGMQARPRSSDRQVVRAAAHVVRTGGNPVPSPRCQAKRGDRIDEIASCRSEKSAEVVQDARVMPW